MRQAVLVKILNLAPRRVEGLAHAQEDNKQGLLPPGLSSRQADPIALLCRRTTPAR
jgi:hypothetical protein